MSAFHLVQAKLYASSGNSNRVKNLGAICEGLSGHQPKVERVADMSALHKTFVAQHKHEKDEVLLSI